LYFEAWKLDEVFDENCEVLRIIQQSSVNTDGHTQADVHRHKET